MEETTSDPVKVLYRMKGPHIISSEDGAGTFCIDLSHYYEVWKERRKRRLHVYEKQPLPDHPMIGKKLKSSETGKVYLVESASKHWFAGYYVLLLLNCGGSHRCVYWDTHGCFHPDILKSMKETHEELYLVEEDVGEKP